MDVAKARAHRCRARRLARLSCSRRQSDTYQPNADKIRFELNRDKERMSTSSDLWDNRLRLAGVGTYPPNLFLKQGTTRGREECNLHPSHAPNKPCSTKLAARHQRQARRDGSWKHGKDTLAERSPKGRLHKASGTFGSFLPCADPHSRSCEHIWYNTVLCSTVVGMPW